MNHIIAFTHSQYILSQKLASRTHTIRETDAPHTDTHVHSHSLTLMSFHTHTISEICIYPTHSHTHSRSSAFVLTFVTIFSNTLRTRKMLAHNARTNTDPRARTHACTHRHIHTYVYLSSTYAEIHVVRWVCELSSSLKSKVQVHIFLDHYHMVLKMLPTCPVLNTEHNKTFVHYLSLEPGLQNFRSLSFLDHVANHYWITPLFGSCNRISLTVYCQSYIIGHETPKRLYS